MIRVARQTDVPAIVAIHLESFSGYFLTFLGPRFLRVLYSEILNTPDHVAFVAQDGSDASVGFIFGVVNQSEFYALLVRRRWFVFAVASLGAIIRQPTIIPRLIRALGRSKTSQIAVTQALLISIAVTPNAVGQGIGQHLVECFLRAMKEKGITSVSLTTDRDNNQRTNAFYQELGFHIARDFVTPEGRAMNEYVISLA